jgi:hypothetical protein
MSLEIAANNSIILDGQNTALKVTQTGQGTIVYTPESTTPPSKYKEHLMPHVRYSLTHDNPKPTHTTSELAEKFSVAGRAQFEADVRSLLGQLSPSKSKETI